MPSANRSTKEAYDFAAGLREPAISGFVQRGLTLAVQNRAIAQEPTGIDFLFFARLLDKLARDELFSQIATGGLPPNLHLIPKSPKTFGPHILITRVSEAFESALKLENPVNRALVTHGLNMLVDWSGSSDFPDETQNALLFATALASSIEDKRVVSHLLASHAPSEWLSQADIFRLGQYAKQITQGVQRAAPSQEIFIGNMSVRGIANSHADIEFSVRFKLPVEEGFFADFSDEADSIAHLLVERITQAKTLKISDHHEWPHISEIVKPLLAPMPPSLLDEVGEMRLPEHPAHLTVAYIWHLTYACWLNALQGAGRKIGR